MSVPAARAPRVHPKAPPCEVDLGVAHAARALRLLSRAAVMAITRHQPPSTTNHPARPLHTHWCQLLEDAEMERNADDFSGGSSSGGYGNTGNVSGSAGYGAGASGSGSSMGSSTGTSENASGVADRARDLA